jgi:lysyl-tRNA synthetase class 1
MPVPIFYEHLLIDGKKMSASIGNVIYPHEWLEVAPPQLLRFLYNKKLMKTRNFSWKELPKLYDEYDRMSYGYWGEKLDNTHKRLFEFSHLNKPLKSPPIQFSMAAFLSRVFADEESFIGSVDRTGHYSKENHESIIERRTAAEKWASKFGEGIPTILEDPSQLKLEENQKLFLNSLGDWLSEVGGTDEEIQSRIYVLSKDFSLPTKEAFRAIYIALLEEERGPKASTLISALDKKWVIERFKYNYK